MKDIMAPMFRNALRYMVGAAIMWVVGFLVLKGVINADLFTPEDVEAFLDSPQIQTLILGLALSTAALVERAWLFARKTGGPT